MNTTAPSSEPTADLQGLQVGQLGQNVRSIVEVLQFLKQIGPMIKEFLPMILEILACFKELTPEQKDVVAKIVARRVDEDPAIQNQLVEQMKAL